MRTRRAEQKSGAAAAEDEVERNLRFNFVTLLAHGLLGQTGFRLVQAPTFLPYFVSELAGNASAVGILRAVQSLGQFLSPVLSASIIEHRPHAKWMGVLFGSVMRVQILFIALVALLVPSEYSLAMLWLVIAVFGLALGMQGVVFQFVLSKAIPAERRGGLMGLRNAVASGSFIGVALVGGYLVDRYGFPDGYGYTFLLGFLLTSAGLVGFALVREPASHLPRERERFAKRLLQIPELLQAERHFRRFLLARLLGAGARGVMPLYTPFVALELGMTGTRLAMLSIFFIVAQGGSGLLWGPLADRRGFKAVFGGALVCWMAGSLLMVTAPTLELVYLVFALVGAGVGGFMLASQNLVLEFGTQSDRPMRIATSNSLSELISVAGFLAAGFAADLVSFRAALLASVALQVLAVLQIRRVAEPRLRLRVPLGMESERA